MKDNFEPIFTAFKQAGVDVSRAGYSITEYSLNTDLSFKFANVDEFLFFLELSAPADKKDIEHINSLVMEAGVNPDKFFYVNFYKPKVAEL